MRHFINSREVLLVHDSLHGKSFIGETAYFGDKLETALDAWKANAADGITAFTRFDLDSLKGEDVTEEVAKAWLYDQTGLTIHDEMVLPDFVRTSDAWDSWCRANDGVTRPVLVAAE